MILSLVKAIHIAALVVWCAGLVALPLMLSKHEIGEDQRRYARLRVLTHATYSYIVTPAAVVAITAGTLLIFLQGVFVPWMFAKLVAVGLLVVLHAVIGKTVIAMSERRGSFEPRSSVWMLGGTLATMTLVLALVLGKPVLPSPVPDWLESPRERHLPVDEIPT
ncbi:CopD family protein [Fulvimarina endophytica]|uniref:CopD family protein n=1 Tax=Fulvimarina endophytica TaxID=2293836 RepID=UPI0018F5EE6F|nr:CopD family protein [Fulvimarina endophytica]